MKGIFNGTQGALVSVTFKSHGNPRSNNGNEDCNRELKAMVLEGELVKACNFLVSFERHVEVTSRFVNDECVHRTAYCHPLMKKQEVFY